MVNGLFSESQNLLNPNILFTTSNDSKHKITVHDFRTKLIHLMFYNSLHVIINNTRFTCDWFYLKYKLHIYSIMCLKLHTIYIMVENNTLYSRAKTEANTQLGSQHIPGCLCARLLTCALGCQPPCVSTKKVFFVGKKMSW